MLELIDESLEALLRATVPLAARDVDVSFDPPERDWSAKLTRPTVNLFLRDIRRSSDRARAGIEQVERDGQQVRRLALPRVELRYLATVWTSDLGDERSLLSGVLRSVLAHDEIPASFTPGGLDDLPPLKLSIPRSSSATDSPADGPQMLDGQMKATIDVCVVAAVDVGAHTPVGPPVEVFETRLADRDGSKAPGDDPVRRVAGEVLEPSAVGATVISPHGAGAVNETGSFMVRAAVGDELVIETAPPRTVVVPPVGGVRVT